MEERSNKVWYQRVNILDPGICNFMLSNTPKRGRRGSNKFTGCWSRDSFFTALKQPGASQSLFSCDHLPLVIFTLDGEGNSHVDDIK